MLLVLALIASRKLMAANGLQQKISAEGSKCRDPLQSQQDDSIWPFKNNPNA